MRTFIKRVFKCEYYQIGENEKKNTCFTFPSASTISSYNEKRTNTPCYIRASPHRVCMQAFFN